MRAFTVVVICLALVAFVSADPVKEQKCKTNCDGLEKHCIKYCAGIKFTGGRATELGAACENGCRLDCSKCQRKCELDNAPAKPAAVVTPVAVASTNTTKPPKAPRQPIDACSAARVKSNPLLEVPCACKKAGPVVSPACAKFAEAEKLLAGEKAAAAAAKLAAKKPPSAKRPRTNAKKAGGTTGSSRGSTGSAGTSTGAAAPAAGAKIDALKAKATL